jgi:4-amino-4-deoxy-L-arabinose transferase-like glycosyltransferase
MPIFALDPMRATTSDPSGQTQQLPVYIPEESRFEKVIAVLLLLVSFAYLYFFRRYTTMEPDEGIILQGAQRILHGQVLYRDFFSFFTPGSYYLLALLFKIFGSSILVARTALAVFGGVYSVVTYLLARRACSRGSALFVAGLVTLTTLPYRFLVLHNWDSTLWACWALYCAVRLQESPRWKWAFGTGSFASLTLLFEQSKGAGLIFGLCVGLTAVVLMNREKMNREKLLLNGSQLTGLALGLVWPFVVTLAYFGAQHGLSSMLADWFWPLQHYSAANRVPYGYQNWSESTRHALFGTGSPGMRVLKAVAISPCLLIPVLPPIAIGLLVYWIVQAWRQRAPQAKCAYYVLIGAALSGLLLSVVIVRADIIHFMYLQPLFCVVLAWIVDGRDIPGRVFKAVSPFLNAYVAIAFLVFSMPLLMRAVRAPYKVETRRGVIMMPANDTVVEYVQAQVAPGETILVYPYLPLYYYLTETYSPTRYEYFQPGMNTHEQSQEMVAQLVSGRVRWVVFESSFAEKIPNSWPGTPLTAIANDPVADYIVRNYRTCGILKSPEDRFLFMIRKDLVRQDLACP